MKLVSLSMFKVIGDLVEFMDGSLRYPIRGRLGLIDLALESIYYHRKDPKRGCL